MIGAAKILCDLLAAFALATAMPAGETDTDPPPIDKSPFHLFQPIPSEHLRDVAIDARYATEGLQMMDAGHVQVERA
jgi:hypothetical protein